MNTGKHNPEMLGQLLLHEWSLSTKKYSPHEDLIKELQMLKEERRREDDMLNTGQKFDQVKKAGGIKAVYIEKLSGESRLVS